MKFLLAQFIKCLSFFVFILPRPCQYFLGDVLGFLWFDVFRIRRKVVIDNLTRAYPDWSHQKRVCVGRMSCFYMGRNLIEFCIFPFFDEKLVHRYFDIEGLEKFEKARSKEKGVCVLSLHLGNGDFAIGALGRMGYQMNLISKVFKAKWLNDLWFGVRSRHGTKFISVEKSSFKILRALKKRENVIFVLDQFMGPPSGVETLFFGSETGTSIGLAVMAERSRCPVIPVYSYRRSGQKDVIVFEDEIPFEDQGNKEDNIKVMTQKYTSKVEELIRLHPEQWMWVHRRWKEFRR